MYHYDTIVFIYVAAFVGIKLGFIMGWKCIFK